MQRIDSPSKGMNNLDEVIKKAKQAQRIYATFSQEKVDSIFRAVAMAANNARIDLAKMAVADTGMGIIEDKIIKNHFAAEYIYNKYKHTKTCGVIDCDHINGTKLVADPLGLIAGVIPTTNPTSTVIFKALIVLKTRNAIIFSPHPRAKKSTIFTVKLLLEAAIAAGAPEGIMGWVEEPSVASSNLLMTHPDVDAILATGGPNMVKAAYSSGKPALGVGAGNTPAVIDETANIKMAVSSVLLSKTFDNGMICASEQSIVVVESVYNQVKEELAYRGAYILNERESEQLGRVIMTSTTAKTNQDPQPKTCTVNAEIVGQSAYKIAGMAGLTVPKLTKVLVSEQTSIAEDNPFAHEKLSPVLTLYKAADFQQAIDKAYDLVILGGAGHTAVLYTDDKLQERIEYFALKMPAGRLLINAPAAQGAIGDLYNFKLEPSLTLGCGSWGGNSISENVGVKHLLNYKTVAERRENMLWFKVPSKIYFKRGAVSFALKELQGKKRAFIITDRYLFDSGVVNHITSALKEINLEYQVYFDVKPEPTLSTIDHILSTMLPYNPDVIIALGGGSPMDAAKVVWLRYEQPETVFEDIAMRFMDIRKRICQIPELGKKALLVAIPTTSGTGSEVTPFSVITNDETHVKYALADYALTPNIAIIDPNFVDSMPKGLTAASGIDALSHAIESYASIMATEFTNSHALEAVKLIFEYLPTSYREGAQAPIAREKVHYAATIAGLAFANAFLGVCHSLAHKLGAAFNIPHGIANALLLRQVISFNATDCPKKQSIFPQYQFPNAQARYAQVADTLGLGGKDPHDKVKLLIAAITRLMQEIEIPQSIKEFGVEESVFQNKLEDLVWLAFDDQCTGANPVFPLAEDIKKLYLDAYHGVIDI